MRVLLTLPPRVHLAIAALITALAVVLGLIGAPTAGTAQMAATDQIDVAAPGATLPAAQPVVRPAAAEPRPRPKLPPYRVIKAGKPFVALPPPPDPADPFTFQVGTFNILGSQHTRGPGGYGPGTVRAGRAAGLITSRGVDIVGLQEVQDDQLNVLLGRLGGYSIWPGRALGNNGVRLQIAYRHDLFELVDTGSISTIFDFQQRPIPWVLLRNRETGGEFYFVNIHNSPVGQESQRDAATGIQIGLVRQLRSTGRPVFLVGDTNEHTEFYCRLGVATGLHAANGGSTTTGCVLPSGPLRIDWILGGGGVAFSGYVQDGASLAGISDHYFIHATATVTPEN